MIKKFKDFLVLHDAYDKYMSNWDENWCYGYIYSSSSYMKAFDWRASPEGHDYWDNLDSLWINHLGRDIVDLTFDRLLEA